MAAENTNNNERMRMDHSHATRIQACSRYLAGSLSPEDSEEFEEHFFGCQECAEELKLGEAFAEHLRAAFRQESEQAAASFVTRPAPKPTWIERFWTSFALPVAATACLLMGVVIYQNTMLLPGMRTEMAALSKSQAVPSVPLKQSRGVDDAFHIGNSVFWTAYFYLGKAGKSPSYVCDVEKSDGSRIDTIQLSAPANGQPFVILMRRSQYPAGAYVFKVRSNNSESTKPLGTYTLTLKD